MKIGKIVLNSKSINSKLENEKPYFPKTKMKG